MLATTRTVIVDEIHALASNKRGSHLALSLARLEAVAGRPLVRIGLSATQKPIEEVARYYRAAIRRQFEERFSAERMAQDYVAEYEKEIRVNRIGKSV